MAGATAWSAAEPVVGATFLILVDTLARVLLDPAEPPIGVVTAFFGAPFFIVVMRSTRPTTSSCAASVSPTSRTSCSRLRRPVRRVGDPDRAERRGKSSILRALARLVPFSGDVSIGGTAATALKGRELARRVAVVMQDPHMPAA